jgi:hypothetical protein
MGCPPPLGIASLALGGIGSIFGAVGKQQQTAATSANALYQTQVARNNQIIAEQDAGAAIQASEAKATATSLRSAAQMGHIRVGRAANNIDVNTGSAVALTRLGDMSVAVIFRARLQHHRRARGQYAAQSPSVMLIGRVRFRSAPGSELDRRSRGSSGLALATPARTIRPGGQ